MSFTVGDRVVIYTIEGVTVPPEGVVGTIITNGTSWLQFMPDEPDPTYNDQGNSARMHSPTSGWVVQEVHVQRLEHIIEEVPV